MKKIDTLPAYRFQPVERHPVIEGVWSLETGPGEDRIAPDTSCELIFHLGLPPEEQTGRVWKTQPTDMLYGPLTRVLNLRFEAQMSLRAIRLTPGGIGHLVKDPIALRNASHDLFTLLGVVPAKRLSRAARQGLAELEAAARAVLPVRSGIYASRLAAAVEAFSRMPDVSASGLAANLGISSKTLERTFLRQTGLKPGEFLRIHRFHSARRAVKEGAANLADIAAEFGFSDQAHMTREFQRLAGLTPRRKRAGEGSDVFYDD